MYVILKRLYNIFSDLVTQCIFYEFARDRIHFILVLWHTFMVANYCCFDGQLSESRSRKVLFF